jgi:hypothetical protein
MSQKQDKKTKISSSEVSGIFVAFLVTTIFVIFLYYSFVSIDSTMSGFGILFVVFIFTIISSLVIKSIVLSGDRDININDFGNISLTSFISVFLIVGSTVLSSKSLPIIGRSFENTVGYWWIKTFGDLSTVTKNIFINPNSTEYDYNLIITQVFDDNDQTQFDNNLREQASKFKDVTVNTSDKINMETLYELVKRKHSISEATLVSLATIVALYTCFLPIKYPWIRGS